MKRHTLQLSVTLPNNVSVRQVTWELSQTLDALERNSYDGRLFKGFSGSRQTYRQHTRRGRSFTCSAFRKFGSVSERPRRVEILYSKSPNLGVRHVPQN